MKLADALNVRSRDVISLVGAGGKTSTMFQLATELSEKGAAVLATTTTRIAIEELSLAPSTIELGPDMLLPSSLEEELARQRILFFYSTLDPDSGKVWGVSPEWVDNYLSLLPLWDYLIIEADGSRRLPMKAPLAHEPNLPTATTLLVPIVGIDALGQPLDEDHIYGAEKIMQMMGYLKGSPVTSQLMGAVLMHPALGLKDRPRGARVVPMITQISGNTKDIARDIADSVLTDLTIDRVLLGSRDMRDPIVEARKRIGAVILAAGESRRMGEPKMLLPWGNSTIIRHVCEQVIACRPYEVVIVAGSQFEEIRGLTSDLPVRVVFNPAYADGEMRSSLQVGLQSLWHSSDACMVILGDQPEIQQEVMRTVLMAYHEAKGRLIAPSYDHKRGHPVLIDHAFWPEIMALEPGQAPRDFIRAHDSEIYHLLVDTATVLSDIDTPDDYQRAVGQ